jgi:hypothetical protein
MANYPTHEIMLSSKKVFEPGMKDDFSQSGEQHTRFLTNNQYMRFTIHHTLTLVDFSALLNTYITGARDVFTFIYHEAVSPAPTYSVRFTEAPAIVKNLGGDSFKVESHLYGYAD